MDLARSLNELGVLLYRSEDARDGYDFFGGAVQAILHSRGRNLIEMEQAESLSLVRDESIRRVIQIVTESMSIPPGGQLIAHLQDNNPSAAIIDCILSSAFGKKTPGSGCDVPFMYANVCSMGMIDDTLPEKHRNDVALVVAIFNMALVLHRGLVPGRRHDSRAFVLYSLAACLLCINVGGENVVRNRSANKMLMAVLNNMGYLFCELGMYENSRQLVDLLRMFVASLPESASQEEACERREFLLNAELFHNKLSSAAASA